MFNPAHPGSILQQYLQPELTITALAEHLGMTRANLSMILNGRAGISASTAVKLSEAFDNISPEFWLTMQNNFNLWQVQQSERRKISPLRVLLSQAR